MKQHLEQVLRTAEPELKTKGATPLIQQGTKDAPTSRTPDQNEGDPQTMNEINRALTPFQRSTLSALMKANGKQIAQQAMQDAKADTDTKTGYPAATKHNYIPPDGNTQSAMDYSRDSLAAFNYLQHQGQFWSCFEPQMIGFGIFGIPILAGPHAESRKLLRECARNCTWPYVNGHFITDPNYFEVIAFYLPEHQAGYNNYGVNRLRAQDETVDGWGNNMKRTELLKVKRRYQEQEKQIVDELDRKKAIVKSNLDISKLDRSQPRFGQSHFGGFAPDFQETGEVHGYRSKGSIEWAELRPTNIKLGFKQEMRCIFNAFPPKKRDKDPINLWTEYKGAAWYWRLPEFIMQLNDPANDPPIPGTTGESRTVYLARALNEDRWSKSIQETGKEDPPFWKNSGAPAFRVATWPKTYGDLKDVGITGKKDPRLIEIVNYGDVEELPFATSTNTFSPPLSTAALAARKSFWMFSLPSFMQRVIQNNAEKYRQVYFTTDWENREGEIDKMQRVYALADDGHPSQCFRTQRIPNNIEHTEDNWVKTNFPPDLVDYYQQQKGEINYMMWNYTHTVCTCAWEGNFAGCQGQAIPDERLPESERRDRYRGDWRYAAFEVPLCQWGPGPMGFPSAFVNIENLINCNRGRDWARQTYQGLKDRYSELPG